MTAGVARTIAQGCDARLERAPACGRIKRSGHELVAELHTVDTLCNSPCVYALIGAKQREITAGARRGARRRTGTIRQGRADGLPRPA